MSPQPLTELTILRGALEQQGLQISMAQLEEIVVKGRRKAAIRAFTSFFLIHGIHLATVVLCGVLLGLDVWRTVVAYALLRVAFYFHPTISAYRDTLDVTEEVLAEISKVAKRTPEKK